MPKRFRLLDAAGNVYESETPGELGGNGQDRIYGLLTCASARRALGRGYEKHRVFFANEQIAITAGYRPCGSCLRARYDAWRAGPHAGAPYPWRQTPGAKRTRRAPVDTTSRPRSPKRA